MNERRWVRVSEVADHVTMVMLHRPEAANALSRELLTELEATLAALNGGSPGDVRVVVFTGAGERVFCAGADLKERRTMNEAQVADMVRQIRRVVQAVANLPMPVIAAINGAAFGGGLELALAADLRIAATHASMGLTETSLAILPGAGGTQRLARLIGMGRAKEMIYTAARVDAETALAMGLVNRVVPSAALQTAAIELASAIAANGPLAVRQAKWAIDLGGFLSLPAGLRVEWLAYQAIIPSADRLEGLAAFAEKRPPTYHGR